MHGDSISIVDSNDSCPDQRSFLSRCPSTAEEDPCFGSAILETEDFTEMTKILFQLELPDPSAAPKPEAGPCLCIEDKVRDCIEEVESGRDSGVEWLILKKLYCALKKKKPTKRVKNLMEMIRPTLNKYGYYE